MCLKKADSAFWVFKFNKYGPNINNFSTGNPQKITAQSLLKHAISSE